MAASTLVPPAQRAVASGVTFTLGLASITVDIIPSAVPNKDKDGEFHSLCHECTDPVRLRQALTCPEGHGPFTHADVTRRGKELPDGTIQEFTPEEVAAIRGADSDDDDEDAPRGMTLNVVPVAQLMEHTLPGDVVYRLRPNKKQTAKGSYELLRVLVTQALRSGKCLVGEMAVRGKPRLFWLGVRHDQVIAQALMRPDDIAPFDSITSEELPERVRSMAADLIKQLADDFDPAHYRNQIRERAQRVLAEKLAAEGPSATVTPIKRTKDVVDYEQLLGSMLQASA